MADPAKVEPKKSFLMLEVMGDRYRIITEWDDGQDMATFGLLLIALQSGKLTREIIESLEVTSHVHGKTASGRVVAGMVEREMARLAGKGPGSPIVAPSQAINKLLKHGVV